MGKEMDFESTSGLAARQGKETLKKGALRVKLLEANFMGKVLGIKALGIPSPNGDSLGMGQLLLGEGVQQGDGVMEVA
jgi:hypothetical protein